MTMECAENDHGKLRGAISNDLVALHRQYFGKGPDRAKTYLFGRVVVCVMYGGYTVIERALYQGGREEVVRLQRAELQDSAGPSLRSAIQRLTGCRVVGFVAGSHNDPDITTQVFLLDQPVGTESSRY
jgi:uncharacterized protein YbcI